MLDLRHSRRKVPGMPRCSSGHSARRAFTLFEALVALAVFSFAVIGFLWAYDATLDAAREVRREAIVRQIMEDRIAWLEIAELVETDNRIDGPLPGMKIRETIQPERLIDEEQNILQGFWRAAVVVEWETDGRKESMEASFLRFAL
jgi:type II secretory pathway component PulJ